MGDFSDFERRHIIDMHLAGGPLRKIATVLGVLRVTVSKVLSAYRNLGKRPSAKKNVGQTSLLTERDISVHIENYFERSQSSCSMVNGRTDHS